VVRIYLRFLPPLTFAFFGGEQAQIGHVEYQTPPRRYRRDGVMKWFLEGFGPFASHDLGGLAAEKRNYSPLGGYWWSNAMDRESIAVSFACP
jgi:hypothetical protein